MAAATATKSGPIEGRTTHFRTQMVNGKPQIYFDEIAEELPVRPPPKAKRNSRAINTIRTPEQPQTKPKPVSQKPPPQNAPSKQPTKTHKIVVNEKDAAVGVFMTMEEIAELVKAVKDTSKASSSSATENRGMASQPSQSVSSQIYGINPPPPQPPAYFPPEPILQQQMNDNSSTVGVPPLDLPSQLPAALMLGPTSPREEGLGLMADKKRRKWLRDKAEMDRMRLEVEYDQLKHQLSPSDQKGSTVTDRLVFPSDYSTTNKPPMPPPGMSPGMPPDNAQNDYYKTGLMEKKQQQWRQENAEKAPVWNPFGRPGAGAPNMAEVEQRVPQPPATVAMSYRPVDPSSVTSNIVINDQTRIPAAMRTNLLLGNVRFEDDVKIAKEMERRQWRDDLQRQIEDNKRKKFTQQETERRQDFLHENVQPLVQEASTRHQQQQNQQQTKDPSPTPLSNAPTTSNNGQDPTKSHRHDSIVKQTYDKIVEATELAKYEKKQQLIEKLKRNGHKTDLLARTLPDMKTPIPEPTHRPVEKTYESSPKKAAPAKVEPVHLNTVTEHQQSFRAPDTRRDEAVNTIDSTFRSDNGVQTDLRMIPQNQMFKYTREESDLPPQVPNHLIRDGKQSKKNVRIRSHEDTQHQRRSSVTTTHSNHSQHNDSYNSQSSNQRPQLDPRDLVHRPLWNYQNGAHREYVSNSKRDPKYLSRQRGKQPDNEQATAERQNDTQKRTPYNRWNSDSELQHKRKETKATTNNQPRPIISKQTHHPQQQQQQPEVDLPRGQPKERTFALLNTDDPLTFRNISSLDKYEHFIPYTRSDEILDPARAFSPLPQSRETSARHQRLKPNAYDDRPQRATGNVQAPPYHVPPSQQQHILQQLTAIKENLVRRQQEVATSMNAIPV